jgi:ribonuclease HI
MIACQKSGKMIKGSFYEFSSNASSYRGELLGLVAIHTLILHVCRFYQPTSACGKIICDSKSALYKSSQKGQHRIRQGVPQADLFRALRLIHQEMPGANLTYKWVKSHQDSRIPWHLLSLEEQLNTTCDELANNAVARALSAATTSAELSLLPFEKAAVVVDNIMITSNIAPAVRSFLGKVEAKKFYTKAINRVNGSNKGGLGWPAETFDSVDWKAIADAISNQPEGFQIWLSKQAIGVCATQKKPCVFKTS